MSLLVNFTPLILHTANILRPLSIVLTSFHVKQFPASNNKSAADDIENISTQIKRISIYENIIE